jgi:hypothetical protein
MPAKCTQWERARVHVKVLKCNVVVRVWPLEQGLKDHKVVPRQATALRGVRDAKEGGELRAADARQVALGRDRTDKLFTVQEPARSFIIFEVFGREKERKQENALFTIGDGLCVRVEGPPPALYL